MDKSGKSYFIQIFQLIIIAFVSFLAFKAILPKRLFSEKTIANANIMIDSLMLQAMADTANVVEANDSAKTAQATLLPSMDMQTGMIDPTVSAEGYKNMGRFYAKLHAIETTGEGKVRIAYFGDSMNDGDFIVQDIRSIFQENYGGKGVGFVGITSLSAASRGSVRHQYSDTWVTQSSVKTRNPSKPFGIDGQVYFSINNADWVKFAAQGQAHAESLYSPTLFYGKSANDTASVSIKLSEQITEQHLNPQYMLNTMALSNTCQNIQLTFNNADSIPIYGLNFDNKKGVHIDNFSIRGNSGLPLSIHSVGMMNAFDRILNYDLIILQYGANVLNSKSQDYNWYERNMTVVVRNLHACFPKADILIISTADKSSMIEEQMQTDPAVVSLAIAQRNYATNTNSAFINLYHLMGGEQSMIEWVDTNMAAKDYTHFTALGSKKIGQIIYNEINRGYIKYKANSSGADNNAQGEKNNTLQEKNNSK